IRIRDDVSCKAGGRLREGDIDARQDTAALILHASIDLGGSTPLRPYRRDAQQDDQYSTRQTTQNALHHASSPGRASSEITRNKCVNAAEYSSATSQVNTRHTQITTVKSGGSNVLDRGDGDRDGRAAQRERSPQSCGILFGTSRLTILRELTVTV